MVLLVMSLTTTPQQEALQVAAAHDEGRPVLWAHAYGPAICLVIGTVLLAAAAIGGLLGLRSRRAQRDFPDEWASFDDLRETLE